MGADSVLEAPTVAPARGWAGVSAPTILAGTVLAASVALHLRDPHQQGSWGFCPWFALTGTYCPACGGLRAVNDLTNGNFSAAFSSNALFVAAIPAISLAWLRSVHLGWRGVRRPVSPRTVRLLLWGGAVLILVFTVVRNLPFGAWLAP